MAETGIWKKFSDFLVSPPATDPEELKELLGEDDSVSLAIPTLNSTYKPRAWIDRNTFFRSVFTLTQRRVLILKSGPKVNVLRDIELDTVTHHSFASPKGKGLRLEIRTVDTEDVIRFHRQYEKEFDELVEKFPEALRKSLKSAVARGGVLFCMHCGAKVLSEGLFCSACGKKVRI